MVSIYTKIGIPLILIGFCLPFLTITFKLPIPFVYSKHGRSSESVAIPSDGSSIDVLLANDLWSPYNILLTTKYTLYCENGTSYVKVFVLYSSKNLFGQVPYTSYSIALSDGQTEDVTRSTMLNAAGASTNFDLYLRISVDPDFSPPENRGDAYLQHREVEVLSMLFASIIPLFMILCGIGITIGGFFYNYRRLAKGVKPVDVNWEPSLKWGKGEPTKEEKKPTMAIKRTETPKSSPKKFDAQTTPKNGAQQICKFCGKSVPESAFFCQHCFGKLK